MGWILASALISAQVTYQQGANSYSGVKAANMWTSGGSFLSSTDVHDARWCIGDLSSYSITPILRFEGIALPAGSTLTKAELTFVFSSWSSGQKVVGHYVAAAWNEDSNLTWTQRVSGNNWGAPGARQEGSDIVAAKSFTYDGFAGDGQNLSKTAELDLDIVKGWLAHPETNFGVTLNVDLYDHHTDIVFPNNDNQVARPILTLTYTEGGGGGTSMPTGSPPPATPPTTPSASSGPPATPGTAAGCGGGGPMVDMSMTEREPEPDNGQHKGGCAQTGIAIWWVVLALRPRRRG